MSAAGDSKDSEFEWELCRENIQPLREGRRVRALTQALASHARPASAQTRCEEAFQPVLLELQKEEEGDEGDPLSACLSFISWFDEQFPIGRHKMFYEYLWTMTNKLTEMSRYSEDERMMKVWKKLASNSLGNDFNIFQHANSVGSLKKNAAFYVAWSASCEEKGSWDEARRVMARARKAGAIPITTLNEADDELEMRILRREREREGVERIEEEELEHENGESRRVFTRLMGEGDANTAPVIRLPSISAHQGVSSRIPASAIKKHKSNSTFEVCMDVEEDTGSWLEDIYDVPCYVDKISLTENARNTVAKTDMPASTPCPLSSFQVWEEGQETKPRARLMLRRLLIRDSSIEESLLDRMAVVFAPLSPSEPNQPKNLHLCRHDIKPLIFD